MINLGGKTVYHLGDTGLFSDLALPGKRDSLDAAIVPIGGHYTMDRHDAVEAVKLVGAPTVIPCHYDTFPPIETDDEAFKSRCRGRDLVEGDDPAAGRGDGESEAARFAFWCAPLEPQRQVLDVVSHEEGAQRREQGARHAVVDALAAHPEAATVRVVADQPITVCPWPGSHLFSQRVYRHESYAALAPRR